MNRQTLKPGTGIATLLMIFVVLAMAVLSVLSYLRVLQDHKSTQRQVEYATSYAKANAQAMYIQDQVKQGFTQGVQPLGEGYTFTVEISEEQFLEVVLDSQGNAISWKTSREEG